MDFNRSEMYCTNLHFKEIFHSKKKLAYRTKLFLRMMRRNAYSLIESDNERLPSAHIYYASIMTMHFIIYCVHSALKLHHLMYIILIANNFNYGWQ